MHYFNDVSLLITHYNRSKSLENLLESFSKLNCHFGQIVVSDDASREPHIHNVLQLQKIFTFKLVTGEKNKGLGNNMNKGHQACEMPFILYVQEDFTPTSLFPEELKKSVQLMQDDTKLDIVRFFSNHKYPYLKSFDDKYSVMYTPTLGTNYKKIYSYSDNPHLRRNNFLQKFGNYAEGISGDKTEYRMCISFIQKNGKGLFYNDYKALFDHKNDDDEPSMMNREYNWKNSNKKLIAALRHLYRQIKYNADIWLMKPLSK